VFLPNKCQDTYGELFQSIVDNYHASNLQFNVQTLKMQSFVQLQLYLVDFRLFCGMMDGLAFLPVPDLTNGIHLLRTLCPDDPPEAAEFLDYFDLTYISDRLRQQIPAQNQAVRRRPTTAVTARRTASSKSGH
jgi:hypothetical protein